MEKEVRTIKLKVGIEPLVVEQVETTIKGVVTCGNY
jgi:hypothetical protein